MQVIERLHGPLRSAASTCQICACEELASSDRVIVEGVHRRAVVGSGLDNRVDDENDIGSLSSSPQAVTRGLYPEKSSELHQREDIVVIDEQTSSDCQKSSCLRDV
jgi:hypothetical protein